MLVFSMSGNQLSQKIEKCFHSKPEKQVKIKTGYD